MTIREIREYEYPQADDYCSVDTCYERLNVATALVEVAGMPVRLDLCQTHADILLQEAERRGSAPGRS